MKSTCFCGQKFHPSQGWRRGRTCSSRCSEILDRYKTEDRALAAKQAEDSYIRLYDHFVFGKTANQAGEVRGND